MFVEIIHTGFLSQCTFFSLRFNLRNFSMQNKIKYKSITSHFLCVCANSVEIRKSSGGSLVEVGSGDENFVPLDIGGRSSRSESKVSCGKGDIDLSSVSSSTRSLSISSVSSAVSTPSHSAR